MIEKQLHFDRDCQWKEFKFRVGCGGLKLEALQDGKCFKV